MFSKIADATKVFNELLKNGEVNIHENPEFYEKYCEVYDVFINMAENFDMKVMKIGDIVYMLPNSTNEVFGVTEKEIKALMPTGTALIDHYLFQYITLLIFSKFYSVVGDAPKLLTYVSFNSMIEYITANLKVLAEDDNIDEIEEENKISINTLYKRWDNFLIDEDGKKETGEKLKKTTLRKVLKALEKERLITVHEDDGTFETTRRCDDLMKNFYLGYERRTEVSKFIEEVKGRIV